MSKHTDTGRAGKKLWILIPVIAVLIIAAALVFVLKKSGALAAMERMAGEKKA